MRKLACTVVLTGATLLLAACGGGGGDGSGAAAGSSPASNDATVSVRNVGDSGNVLVSSDGMTLYTSDVEAGGMIRCTGACTSFWKPLEPAGGKPTANGDAGKLAVIKRPDGTRQVTANGQPLYTFAEDAPGDIKGDGFTDDFGGKHFVWHAVAEGGKQASSGGSGDDGGGAYSGGGY